MPSVRHGDDTSMSINYSARINLREDDEIDRPSTYKAPQEVPRFRTSWLLQLGCIYEAATNSQLKVVARPRMNTNEEPVTVKDL